MPQENIQGDPHQQDVCPGQPFWSSWCSSRPFHSFVYLLINSISIYWMQVFLRVWVTDNADKVPSLMKHIKHDLRCEKRRTEGKKGTPGRGNSKSKHIETGNSLLLSTATLCSLLPHSHLNLEVGRNNNGEGYAIGLSHRQYRQLWILLLWFFHVLFLYPR